MICDWDVGNCCIYKNVTEGFSCCGCKLRGGSPSADQIATAERSELPTFFVDTAEEMLVHMKEHIDAGYKIPVSCMDKIIKYINKE